MIKVHAWQRTNSEFLSFIWLRIGVTSEKEVSFHNSYSTIESLPRWLSGKKSSCQCSRCRRHEFDPWVRKSPRGGNGNPTPVFLPTKTHGQRSLMGYSPGGHRESDATQRLNNKTSVSAEIECPPIKIKVETSIFQKRRVICSQNKKSNTSLLPYHLFILFSFIRYTFFHVPGNWI